MPKNNLGVEVTVFDKSDSQVRQRRGNWIDGGFRDWTQRITGWALAHGYEVEIAPINKESANVK